MSGFGPFSTEALNEPLVAGAGGGRRLHRGGVPAGDAGARDLHRGGQAV